MAYKNYKIRDNWLDIDKYNDVDIQSIDGVIQTVKVNGEDVGGGGSWRTVFEGSVTTETLFDIARAIIQDYELNADTIKVTFDGVEYECEKNADGSYGAVMVEISYDWSDYPFSLINTEGGLEFTTESAGTYTLKIEEPQGGGGSSDFSTAEVTINAIIEGSPTLVEKGFVAEILYPEVTTNPYAGGFDDFNGNIILYKNDAFISIDSLFASDSNETIYVASDNPTAPTISGNATYDNETGRFIITGDCTITVTMVQGN